MAPCTVVCIIAHVFGATHSVCTDGAHSQRIGRRLLCSACALFRSTFWLGDDHGAHRHHVGNNVHTRSCAGHWCGGMSTARKKNKPKFSVQTVLLEAATMIFFGLNRICAHIIRILLVYHCVFLNKVYFHNPPPTPADVCAGLHRVQRGHG